MESTAIKTDTECQAALRRIETLFHATEGTPEGDELDMLVKAVEQYEEQAYPIAMPDPVTAIRFREDQQKPM